MTGRTDPAVSAFMTGLDHPLKGEIEAVRALILDLDPAVGEGIKWKAPTFRTGDDFATVNLRSTDSLQLILHLGAKVRPGMERPAIDDPAGLLKWLGKDRCLATLGVGEALRANLPALQVVLRQWIALV